MELNNYQFDWNQCRINTVDPQCNLWWCRCFALTYNNNSLVNGGGIMEHRMDQSFDSNMFEHEHLSSSLSSLDENNNHFMFNEQPNSSWPDLNDNILLHDRITNFILIFVYCVLIIVSAVGNTLVIRVLFSVKRSTGPMLNISTGTGTSKNLIVNLAVSDLLLTSFNIPMNLVRQVSRDWPFGELFCTAMPFVQSICVYSSSWTMMIIAFERYRNLDSVRRLFLKQKEINLVPLAIVGTKLESENSCLSNVRSSTALELTKFTVPEQKLLGSQKMIRFYFQILSSILLKQSEGSLLHISSIGIILQQKALHRLQEYQRNTFDGATASGTTNTNGIASSTLSTSHQHIVLGMSISDNLWFSICRNFSRLYGRLCYSFCSGCCCCCPATILPPTPKTVSQQCCGGRCQRRLPAGIILLMVWAIALILSYPHSLYTKLVRYDNLLIKPMTRCTINNFPDNETRIWLTVYTILTQYVIPIGLTSFFYTHIGLYLWHHETVGLSEGRRIILLQRKRRRVRMLIYVVLVFAVCWLPLNLYLLLVDINAIAHHQLIFFGVHWFAMSSFRTKAKSILKCFVPERCIRICVRRLIGSNIPSVNRTEGEIGDNQRKQNCGHYHQNGRLMRKTYPNTIDCNGNDTSLSSNSMTATGRQQAISELNSMCGLMDRELLDSSTRYSHCNSSNINYQYSKEQRLALMTTQSGKRRHHQSQH
ncbi:Serpentine type 7TM GPCR chemoreceptor Srsx [Blomia tropicalis]|nr:Serpentine type 7TM GPCR chemoreceptor Srsx [Blomia tropicalis]